MIAIEPGGRGPPARVLDMLAERSASGSAASPVDNAKRIIEEPAMHRLHIIEGELDAALSCKVSRG